MFNHCSMVRLRSALLTAGLVAATGAAVVTADPTPAAARSGAIYAWSSDKFWQVGRLDKKLTMLCRRNAFNQVKKNRLKIWYTGRDNIGRGTTGVAKYGWNLHDPTGAAVPDVTYHFINDGYSDCTVYVAP